MFAGGRVVERTTVEGAHMAQLPTIKRGSTGLHVAYCQNR